MKIEIKIDGQQYALELPHKSPERSAPGKTVAVTHKPDGDWHKFSRADWQRPVYAVKFEDNSVWDVFSGWS